MGAEQSASLEKEDYEKEGDRHFSRGSPGQLRLLCLHGYGSNNDITGLQTTNLRLATRHGVSCDLLQATKETDAQDEILELLSSGQYHMLFNSCALSPCLAAACTASRPILHLVRLWLEGMGSVRARSQGRWTSCG